MPDSEPEELLNVDQMAKLAGVDRKTIIRWADGGGLPVAERRGQRRYFRRSEVEPLLQDREG